MIFAVLASDLQKDEIARSPFFRTHEVIYSENDSLWAHHMADIFMDLRFVPTPERIADLATLLPKPVLVHSVTKLLKEIHPSFIRINAWPGFLKGEYLEATANREAREAANELLGNRILYVEDKPGFVSARIVAMIINEAYFALDAGTAAKEEIDIAMKLGTGYPYGPFEWAEKIGLKNITELLQRLREEDELYELAPGIG